MSAQTAGGDPDGAMIDALTDGRGYYRMADLAPGQYTVRLHNAMSRNEGSSIPTEFTVEVTGAEYVRCDFTLETGRIEGVVQGLNPGEKAGVGVFFEAPDARTLAALSMAGLQERMVTYMETAGSGAFQFDDIPPGDYFVGAVALPGAQDSGETDLAASLAAGRYVFQAVKIEAGKVATLDATLPQ